MSIAVRRAIRRLDDTEPAFQQLCAKWDTDGPRESDLPVIARIERDEAPLDLRTVAAEADARILRAL